MRMSNNLKTLTDEQLEQELAARKAAKAEQEKPRPLPNPNFQRLQESCVACIEKIEKEGDPEGDCKHWIYESALEAVFGKDVWKWINSKNC